MPLDSESQAFIDYLNSLGNPPSETVSPQEARRNFSRINKRQNDTKYGFVRSYKNETVRR